MRDTQIKTTHKKPTSKNKFLIEGFKWFDKVNGNTYHTIKITDINTNEIIFKSEGLVYGYGDQWRDTAFKQLVKMGLVNESEQYDHEKNRERFIYRVNENCLKRECLNL